MPTGGFEGIDFVTRHSKQFSRMSRPERLRILDIGVGGGRWGLLMRDCFEWHGERYFKKDWVCTVNGIEAWAEYHNPVWDYAYNHVRTQPLQDSMEWIENDQPYDLIIFMDVIEHLPKEEGVAILKRLVARCRKQLYICFPWDKKKKPPLRDRAIYGNPFEKHVALWNVQEDLVPNYKVLHYTQTAACIQGEYKGSNKPQLERRRR